MSKHEIFGVPGTLVTDPNTQTTFRMQRWTSDRREGVDEGGKVLMHVEIRYDDTCVNGHNSFAITAYGWYDRYRSRDVDFAGTNHVLIARIFPELAPLIKWHHMNAGGPMYYLANTLYHAGDRDSSGLRKGEKRQLLAGGKTPMWDLVADATGCKLKTPLKAGEDITALPLYRLDAMASEDEIPATAPRLYWQPCWRVGEGKDRDFDAARSCAIWPDATDEQLSLPREELKALLEARLPALVEEFKGVIEAIGFQWEPQP